MGLLDAFFGSGKPSGKDIINDAAKSTASEKAKHRGSGFDPEGLERAAKAARQIEGSKYANECYDLIEQQELTKQMEHQMHGSAYEAQSAQYHMQGIEKEAEEARKTLGAQTDHVNKQAQYKDGLERERYAAQLQHQRALKEEELRRQEESILKQEQAKRARLEHEAKLRLDTELKRVDAETKGRIKQERDNHDLTLERTKAEAKEARDTVLESIKLATATVGNGLHEFLSDKERMTASVGLLSALALGIYGAKVTTGVVGRFVEARLGKPSLVRETSRRSVRQLATAPLAALKSAFGGKGEADALKGVILEARLADRLRRVATTTAHTKRNRAPFRHLLLHGPPGTGKTLFAKGLARQSGLEYAILTGGDVAPLGRDAVTEIHRLFDWAQTSSKGLLLFVDEADAFLQRRATTQISEDARNALNAFLYRTGEASDKFMLVYATNAPEQFDGAITDRVDEMVAFELPGPDERERMIAHYLEAYISKPGAAEGGAGGGVVAGAQYARAIKVEGVGDAELAEVVAATEGFSGREISKLAIAWQAAAYGQADATFTPELMRQCLSVYQQSRQQKAAWDAGEISGGLS